MNFVVSLHSTAAAPAGSEFSMETMDPTMSTTTSSSNTAKRRTVRKNPVAGKEVSSQTAETDEADSDTEQVDLDGPSSGDAVLIPKRRKEQAASTRDGKNRSKSTSKTERNNSTGDNGVDGAVASPPGSNLADTRSGLSLRQRKGLDKDKSIMSTRTVHDDLSEEHKRHKILRRRRRSERIGQTGVQFGTIEIREFPITLGDNPGGVRGPPLTIQWEHHSVATIDMEEFEEGRPQRRKGGEMIIPANVRDKFLREAGHSRGEIQGAVKRANIARNRRKRTEELKDLRLLDETMEKARRGTMNSVLNRGKKQREREFIRHAMSIHKAKTRELHESRQELVRAIDEEDGDKNNKHIREEE